MRATADFDEVTIPHALFEAVQRFGDREAFTFVDRRLTFRDIDAESDDVARALLAFGIGRGDRVAVWMASHSEWPALYFGVLKAGTVLVPLSTRLRPDELAFGLAKSNASLLFFKGEVRGRIDYGELLREVNPELRAPSIRAVVDLAELDTFLERGSRVSATAVRDAEHALRPRDEAMVLFTSGTTSVPKGVQLHHAGMLYGSIASNESVGVTEEDVYFSLQPFYHGGGAIVSMLRPITSGCRVVTQPYFEPGAALAAMEAERATILSGHQPHYVEYLNHPTLPQRRLSLDRALLLAPPDLFRNVQERMGIDGLLSGYGMTETHLLGTHSSLNDSMEARFNTNGRPALGVELQIRDPDDGTLLGPDEAGEIFLRVPYPMMGYLDEPELTAEVLDSDGWYRTGDNGVIRADGNLCLLGRVRDMIRVGGENLSGAEVEAVLLTHPAVKQVAVVGAPDQRLGEVVAAFVELKPDVQASEGELIAHCRGALATFKVPRAVHFVSEWPMTGSGKIQKRMLLNGG
jgi:acyl-CoA synthetase (AMP-forming)/AMP-acid ligase II